jgi:hypothetical protein
MAMFVGLDVSLKTTSIHGAHPNRSLAFNCQAPNHAIDSPCGSVHATALPLIASALNGSATWEEDESENLKTTIKSISHGFMIGPGTEIYCDGCGVTAIFGRTLSRSEIK